MNDNTDPQDASSSLMEEKTSIGALLEVANTIRKEKLNEDDHNRSRSVDDINGEEVKDTTAIMSDVDTGAVEDDNPSAAAQVKGKPAYSAATVAAISSLAAGESPLFFDDDDDANLNNNNGNNTEKSTKKKKSALAKKEITLQDRASAVMSVYKDYLDEEVKDYVQDNDHKNENNQETDAESLNVHEKRKEGHKVAILDKFCKDVEEGSINVNGTNYLDDSEEEEDENTNGSSNNTPRLSKSSSKKRFTNHNHPTAASTTAAFRLKAEVALKAAATKTKSVATTAAVAMKTKYKDKTTSSAQLLEKIGRGVENDYDFANYDEDVPHESSEDMEYGIVPPHDNNNDNGQVEANMDGFYGLHMLQRDDEIKSLKRKGKINNEEMESMQRFNDLCDELGVTPGSHSNLHYFYQQQRRSRYKYPIFRSKKFKRAMLYGGICLGFVVMIIALVSAITNGFRDIQRKSAKPLPDWKEDVDWREKEKETWEKSHYDEESDVGMTVMPPPVEQQPVVGGEFRPRWFSDRQGWLGGSYEDAKHFCGSIKIHKDQDDTLQLCPMEVYCPKGPVDEKPLHDGMDAYEGEQWAPISDNYDQWVMIGDEGHETCFVNSHQMSVGTLLPLVKRHIMCCQGPPEIPANVVGIAHSSPETGDDAIATANQLDQLFYDVSSAYLPIWYDRSTGWQGRTYEDAVTWCDAYHNYIPCPYEVYCPNQKNLMAGMLLDQSGESWAPIVNHENEWVQVGTDGTCELYSDRYGTEPDWGVSGANNEEITRHIMCCRAHALLPDEEPEQHSNEDATKATDPPFPSPTISVEEQDKESELDFEMLEVQLTQLYNPTWFDRETGWKGQTYREATQFCHNINGYIPCPSYIYCPGNSKKVLGGRKDEGESWAAVVDGVNEWIQVGAGGECNLYSATEGEAPSWGLTGDNNEEITRHILCCTGNQQQHGEENNVEATSLETIKEQEEESNVEATNVDTVEQESVIETATTDAEEIIAEVPETPSTAANNENGSSPMTMLEIVTQNTFHPEWFDSRLGWSGGTYDEANAFCESLPAANNGHWYLCPRQAYCPNGPREKEPLYLQKDAFEGVQWAPVSDRYNGWVLVGKSGQTCNEYFEVNHHDPAWGLDGLSSDMKQHILCCTVPTGIYASKTGDSAATLPTSPAAPNKPSHDESLLLETFAPRWFSAADGWRSGSHDDAIAFCKLHDGVHGNKMDLCPYTAICAEGPGTQPKLGHDIDFNVEGQQWVPLFGQANNWVSISGEKTCLSHWDVHGEDPSWGLDGSNPEVKEHILCCSPVQ